MGAASAQLGLNGGADQATQPGPAPHSPTVQLTWACRSAAAQRTSRSRVGNHPLLQPPKWLSLCNSNPRTTKPTLLPCISPAAKLDRHFRTASIHSFVPAAPSASCERRVRLTSSPPGSAYSTVCRPRGPDHQRSWPSHRFCIPSRWIATTVPNYSHAVPTTPRQCGQ